jgi:hypothetical protein
MTEGQLLYKDGMDIPSLRRNWPDGHDLPQVIADIAMLLASEVRGSVGYLEMIGSRFDDYWIEGGADLCEQFGMFLHCPDGTRIAQWFHEGVVPNAEPVVAIGSEGDLVVLAPNLKSFLRIWANGQGPENIPWDNYELALNDEERTPDRLAQWQTIATKMHRLIDAAPDHPAGAPVADLVGFIESYGAASRQAMAKNPLHQKIARLMDAHIPRGKEIYEYYNVQINIAGDRIEFLPNAMPPDYKERASLPEKEALSPLIFQARAERAQGVFADRGLWNKASLRISPDGLVMIPADWEFEPKFETGGRMTRAELELDLARFPRSDRWRMPWMDELS